MAPDTLDLLRDLYDAFNRGDVEEVLSHADADIEIVDPARTGKTSRGHDAYREFVADWLESWDTYRLEVADFTQNGDRVLVDLIQSGRGRGSGVEVSEPLFNVLTMREGEVSRFEIYPSRDDAVRAAGLAD
jgi:ketosteroid isomerase-like protein